MHGTSLRAALESRRDALLSEWFAETLKSYPDQTAQFLGRVADRFRNPAGHLLRENLAALFDAVFLSDDWPAATDALRELAQLRAVQGFTPEEAIRFIPAFRPIAGSVLVAEADAARDLDVRLARLTGLARRFHEQWRDRIEEVRSNEVGRRTRALGRLAVRESEP